MSLWSKISGAGKRTVNAPIDSAKKLLGIDQARENLTWMGAIAKTLLPSSVKAGRIETFEHAMYRQGVSEVELDKIYTNHFLRFWISATLMLAGWIVGGSYLFGGQWLALFPLIGFSAICFSQMFSASFRAYQVGSRRFCDVAEWLARREVWVLTSYDLPPAPSRKSSTLAVVPTKTTSPTKGGE